MAILSRARALVRNVLWRHRADRDLDDELASYIDLVEAEHRAAGADPQTARHLARRSLGPRVHVAEAVRAVRAGSGLDRLSLDLRSAGRSLSRAPGYAAAAILTLMLGIGANTVFFSVIDAALLKPLPYDDPDRLVEIATTFDRGTEDERHQIGLTWRQLDQWREETALFAAIETLEDPQPVPIDGAAPAGATYAGRISPGLAPMLGIAPLLGRGISDDDVRAGSGVVMLAERFWRAAFDASPAVLGQPLIVSGRAHTIVGVMPATFAWGVGGARASVWLPFDEAAARATAERPFVGSIARVRPGLSLDEAGRLLDAAAPGRHAGMPRDVDLFRIDEMRSSQPGLRLAFGGVTLLLLIACANVANLLLARVLARGREIGVRAALGASRLRIVRLFMVEGAVIATTGGALGLVAAAWGVQLVPRIVPEELGFFSANPLTLDARVFAFCAAAIVVTGILCSLLPALRATRTDVLRSLDGSSRVVGPRPAGRRLRLGLQSAQVALALVLLTGSSLVTTTFVRLASGDPGFDAELTGAIHFALPRAGYPDSGSQREFYEDLQARARKVAGVRAAYGSLPYAGLWAQRTATSDGGEMPAEDGVRVTESDLGYASVMGLSLVAGRWFGPGDDPASEPVAVIDERFAKRYWPGRSPLGHKVWYGPTAGDTERWYTVVGIVRSIRAPADTFGYLAPHIYYLTDRARPDAYGTLLVRSADVPGALASMQALVREIDPEVEASAEVSRDRYSEGLVGPRFYLVVLTALAGLGLLTASVGLYGVLTHSVQLRSREIAVRIALGADPGRVRRLVIRDGLLPVAAGAATGGVAAFWLAGLLDTLLYDTAPHDPLAFGLALAVLTSVAALAAFVPARRATRLDPMATLRME